MNVATSVEVNSCLCAVQGKDLDDKINKSLDRLLVAFGNEILKIIPGKVSTEVDARLSFDTPGSVNKALDIIKVCGLFFLFFLAPPGRIY